MDQNASFSEHQNEAWYEQQGWHFDKNNDFVDKNGNLYNFKKDKNRYEFVQSKIKDHVHAVLQEKYGLVQVSVPSIKGEMSAADARIFTSPDVGTNPVLLLVVQGLGEVPPGMWARKLFTNGEKNQWDNATQCPYIERALKFKWAVVLCDVNHKGLHGTPLDRARHVQRVWEDVVSPSQARCIMVIGFSAGTKAALSLMVTKGTEFAKRVMAIALLDGSTGVEYHNRPGGKWLKERCWCYVQGEDNEQVGNQHAETVPTRAHDKVPGTAVASVMGYFEQWHLVYLAKEGLEASNK